VSHCRDMAVGLLHKRPNSSKRSPRSKPMSPLPVPEHIEGTGSVPRGVEFCVASFGKETPTDRSIVIASIRRLTSYRLRKNGSISITGCNPGRLWRRVSPRFIKKIGKMTVEGTNVEERDEWGRDPSVRAMRGVFARMESGQKTLLERLGISPRDSRLRACREDARDLFARAFSRFPAGRRQNEEDAAALYIHCLIEALKQHGLPIPARAIREDDALKRLVGEATK